MNSSKKVVFGSIKEFLRLLWMLHYQMGHQNTKKCLFLKFVEVQTFEPALSVHCKQWIMITTEDAVFANRNSTPAFDGGILSTKNNFWMETSQNILSDISKRGWISLQDKPVKKEYGQMK